MITYLIVILLVITFYLFYRNYKYINYLKELNAEHFSMNKSNKISIKLALDIIEDSFNLFTKRHFEKLLSKFQISEKELKIAVKEIEKLNPKPANSISVNSTKLIEQVIPDFKIEIINDKLMLSLNGRNKPTMNVSREIILFMFNHQNGL